MSGPKSRVISLRLKQSPAAKLARIARILRRSVGETAALLLEEKLKEEEFAYIEFRDSTVGRQAYVQGTSLAVWEVVLVARNLEMDAARVARHLEWPTQQVEAALGYARANADEIEPILEEVDATGADELRSAVPWLREVRG